MKKLLVLAAVSAMAFGAKAEYWTVNISDAKAVYFIGDYDTAEGSVETLLADWNSEVGPMFFPATQPEGMTWEDHYAGLSSMLNNYTADKDGNVFTIDASKFGGGAGHVLLLLALDSDLAPGVGYTLYRAAGGESGSPEITHEITDTLMSGIAPGGSPSPAPEPTSGLLLLLGVAGLALKRKRA